MSQHRPTQKLCSLFTFLTLFSLTALPQPKAEHTEMDTSAQDHYINALLHKYHLAPHERLFSYRFKHEIYSPLLGTSRQLPPDIEKIAIQQNSYLQTTTYFRDTSLLHNGPKVRSYQLMASKDKKESGSIISAVTDDGVVIEGTLIKRNSPTLLVVGGGFTHYREKMAPMGDLFNNYDVLFFDYRGHGYTKSKLFKPKTWKNLSQQLLGVDPKKVRLGLSEEKDVHAIVQQACRLKKYTNIIGLGVCYSGLIFIKTAALYPNLFTKLILDGCWFSLRDSVETLARDPGLLARSQRHTKWEQNWFIRQRWFQKSVLWLGQKLFDIEFNTVSVLDYAPLLKETMPILFIHGKDDVMIPREQFEILFHATNCRQKVALITSNEHVWNHLKEKELYKEVVETFVNMSYEQFNRLMISPEALIDYKQSRLMQITSSTATKK